VHGATELAEVNISRLLAAGADPNAADQNGKTPLLALLARPGVSRDDPAVQLLLEYGANSEATTPNAYTVLHALAESGDCELLEAYLDYPGTSPNEGTTEGLTPAMAAVRGGRADTLEVLLRRGAVIDPEVVYPDGKTMRYWVANSGNPKLIKLFQEATNAQ
jgi:ankyrin repeat protein